MYIEQGRHYRCICGDTYYQSDPGPCHWQCQECGTIVDEGNADHEFEDLCQECGDVKREEDENECVED